MCPIVSSGSAHPRCSKGRDSYPENFRSTNNQSSMGELKCIILTAALLSLDDLSCPARACVIRCGLGKAAALLNHAISCRVAKSAKATFNGGS
jgi:hypothetical protein